MSDKAPAGWIDRRIQTAMRDEIGALQATVAALSEAVHAHRDEAQQQAAAARAQAAEAQAAAAEARAMVERLGEELRTRSSEAEASLNALREAVERDERIDVLRSRLEGFSAQYSWDMDQMRQSLAAVAESLPIIA